MIHLLSRTVKQGASVIFSAFSTPNHYGRTYIFFWKKVMMHLFKNPIQILNVFPRIVSSTNMCKVVKNCVIGNRVCGNCVSEETFYILLQKLQKMIWILVLKTPFYDLLWEIILAIKENFRKSLAFILKSAPQWVLWLKVATLEIQDTFFIQAWLNA